MLLTHGDSVILRLPDEGSRRISSSAPPTTRVWNAGYDAALNKVIENYD